MIRKPLHVALLLCLCLLVGSVCATPPAAAAVSAHVVVPAPYLVLSADERDAGNLLLLTALAAYFGADVNVVVPLYPAWSFDDIALILVIHHRSHRDIPYIVGLRRQHGWGWGQIAHRLGVHPGAFNRARVWSKKHDMAVGDAVLMRGIAGHWGLPVTQVRAMRARRYPAVEMALAANVSARSRAPLGDVLKARAAKRPWKEVAGGYRITDPELRHPAAAKGHYGAAAGRAKRGQVTKRGARVSPKGRGQSGDQGRAAKRRGGMGPFSRPGKGRGPK